MGDGGTHCFIVYSCTSRVDDLKYCPSVEGMEVLRGDLAHELDYGVAHEIQSGSVGGDDDKGTMPSAWNHDLSPTVPARRTFAMESLLHTHTCCVRTASSRSNRATRSAG